MLEFAASFFWICMSDKLAANRLRMAEESYLKLNAVRQRRKKSFSTADPISLPITGKLWANGNAIEPVRDGMNPELLLLLFWDGRKAITSSKIICDGKSYVPATIDPSILRALALPTGIVSCESPRKLLTDIAKLMAEFTGLPENSIAAASRWALSTWFPEVQLAPGLSLIGPDITAGRQMFQLCHCFCRHPLLLTEVNAAGLRALPTEWNLNLLIQQSNLSAEVQRILNAARRSLGFIPRAGRLLDFHCGVATYTEFGQTGGSGVIPSLEISVVPTRQSLPILDDTMRQKIANNFQPQLLSHRLKNFSKVLDSKFDATGLSPSLRELAQNLSACTPDDPDLQTQIPQFLLVQDKEIRSAAWLEINTVIVEALLAFIHEGKQDCIYVGELTEAAETILAGRGENRKLEPRAIGARLRVLGLITEPRDSRGVRLVLTGEVSGRVHELAFNFSVPSILQGAKRCQHCRIPLTKGDFVREHDAGGMDLAK